MPPDDNARSTSGAAAPSTNGESGNSTEGDVDGEQIQSDSGLRRVMIPIPLVGPISAAALLTGLITTAAVLGWTATLTHVGVQIDTDVTSDVVVGLYITGAGFLTMGAGGVLSWLTTS